MKSEKYSISAIFKANGVLSSNKKHLHGSKVQTKFQCSNQFCIDGDYKKLELPPANNGSVVQVTITPHILEIFEVSIYVKNENDFSRT